MRIGKVIWAVALSYMVGGFCDQKIVYQSVTSGEKTQAEWQVKDQGENQVHISGVSKGSDIEMECLKGYLLQSYSEKTGSSRLLSIAKEEQVLIVNFLENGKQKLKSYKIGKTPWVQEFKFGFQSFLQAEQKTYNFYILNPKDLALHEMVATKDGEETLSLEGKSYDTQKIKITLTGFKKKFWKAYAWFDKQSLWMVKYRANEGPGTPYTEITLVKENGS
jgi:hypothetical protein